MGIPVSPAPLPRLHHVFVRTLGTLDVNALPHECEYVACSHYDLEGRLMTETLLSGAHVDVDSMKRLFPDALVTSVHSYDWIRECIQEAAGRADRTTTTEGMLAVYALRASDEELHLVEHPRALSGTALLRRVASMFE